MTHIFIQVSVKSLFSFVFNYLCALVYIVWVYVHLSTVIFFIYTIKWVGKVMIATMPNYLCILYMLHVKQQLHLVDNILLLVYL